MNDVVKVACVQAEPVAFDRAATIDKLEALAVEAAAAEREQLEAPREQFERGVQVAGAKRDVVNRRHAYILSRP